MEKNYEIHKKLIETSTLALGVGLVCKCLLIRFNLFLLYSLIRMEHCSSTGGEEKDWALRGPWFKSRLYLYVFQFNQIIGILFLNRNTSIVTPIRSCVVLGCI